MPDNQPKPWVKITFIDTVCQEPAIGQLMGETVDAYSLQNTVVMNEDEEGEPLVAVPTHLRFYQKHCIFSVELIDDPAK